MKARKSSRSKKTPVERGALSGARVIAFAATQNPEKAMAFYRDVLGLKVVHEDQFALVFDSGGTTIRVAIVQKVVPAGYTVLGWTVPDIDAAAARLANNGVVFASYPGMHQEENGVWNSPSGARVAWFHDPDGNTLSLTEL